MLHEDLAGKKQMVAVLKSPEVPAKTSRQSAGER
jgi:hypothetical protein